MLLKPELLMGIMILNNQLKINQYETDHFIHHIYFNNNASLSLLRAAKNKKKR